MEFPKMGENQLAGDLSDQDLIRGILPSHAVKHISRLFSLPFETAKHWVYEKVSARRRAEFAQRLLEIMNEQDRRRAEIRRQLEVLANVGRAETVGSPWDDGVTHRLARDMAQKD